MKKHLFTPVVALALAGGFVAEATAQVNPNQLIVWRKAAMQMQGKTFFPIFSMTQPGAAYDAAAAQRSVDQLAVVTQLAWDSFLPATAGNTTTRAKDEIYKDLAKFKERQDTLQSNVQKLGAAVKAGDQVRVGAAAKDVARSCNGCHEDFSTYQFRFKVE